MAAPTLPRRSRGAIVALPGPRGADERCLDGPPPLPAVEVQPATSAAQQAIASAVTNDFLKAEPSHGV